MRTRLVSICLTASCLFFSSLSFARDLGRFVRQLPEQNVEVKTVSSPESTDSSSSVATTVVEESLPPDPQDSANGSTSSSGTTSGKGSGSASGSGSALPATTYVFPTSGEINRYWLRTTVGVKALLGAGFTASWNTWVNTSPKEWHRNGSGWSKRFGSALLDNGINTSVLVLGSRAMHQDPMYRRCDCSGTGARTKHAIKMTFMSPDRSGSLRF